jgi:pimeloyl-ACP methyl ester carboxylesterase
LFLSFGFHPRCASGDAAAHWADSFAKCGYPSFRLDLPEPGDSDGDVPGKVADFIQLVNSGHYAPLLADTMKNLRERFKLSGVVLVGQCSGAVSAIYAAAASKDVKGLVLLDPYFHREEPEGTVIRKEFRRWVLGISAIYDYLKYFRLLVKTNELPKNANLPLVRCWNQLASAGLPILVLKAPALNPRMGDFDYLRYVQRLSHLSHQSIEVRHIEDTNHAFMKGPGKEAVRRHAEQWLRAHFSLTRYEGSETSNDRHSSAMETTGSR